PLVGIFRARGCAALYSPGRVERRDRTQVRFRTTSRGTCQARIRAAAAGCAVTASIGCQTFQVAPEDTADAWQQADRVMYEAKLLGKNRAEHSDRDSRAA
ncbi:MAG TPA: hypothetical protein VID49_09060, partial [Steroidobacteraceae bacterium]